MPISKHHKKKRPNSIWSKKQGRRKSFMQWFDGKKRVKNRDGTLLIKGLEVNKRRKD